jgi:hypothetical protein
VNPPRTDGPGRGIRGAFLIGMVAGFGLAFLALVAVGLLAFGTIGASLVVEVASRLGTGETNELPRFTLEVADDGCGVVRSPTAPTPDSLTY